MTRRGVLVVLLVLTSFVPVPAYAQSVATAPAAAPDLTVEQMKDFLKNARVIRSRQTTKGVTAPKRVTLSNGALTHDAVFQSVDERQTVANLSGGGRSATTELNFVDSYRYNLAAYALAGELGLDHMMPVHVERRWSGASGSMSWFVDTLMDESDRIKKNIQPPNPTEWNYQMYRMRVFSSLVRDTDRNLTNVLITPAWKVMMIDFSRGFRLQAELMHEKDLARMDRALWLRLADLSKESVKKAVGDWLTNPEIDAMLKRRDLLIAHFNKLIAAQGEEKILY
jgi:hypothetical protein